MTNQINMLENSKFNKPFIEIYENVFGKPEFDYLTRVLTIKGYADIKESPFRSMYPHSGEPFKKTLDEAVHQTDNLFEFFEKAMNSERNWLKKNRRGKEWKSPLPSTNLKLRYYDSFILRDNSSLEFIFNKLYSQNIAKGMYKGIFNKYLDHENESLDLEKTEYGFFPYFLKRLDRPNFPNETEPIRSLSIFLKSTNVWYNKNGSVNGFLFAEKEIQNKNNPFGKNNFNIGTDLIYSEGIIHLMTMQKFKDNLKRNDHYKTNLSEMLKRKPSLLYTSSYTEKEKFIIEGELLKENPLSESNL